jgi:hypothetical protein
VESEQTTGHRERVQSRTICRDEIGVKGKPALGTDFRNT